MNITNSDTPTSPCEKNYGPEFGALRHTGLTKREHFAGLAMQGILSSEYVSSFCKEDTVCPAAVSKAAVNYADALLMELS